VRRLPGEYIVAKPQLTPGKGEMAATYQGKFIELLVLSATDEMVCGGRFILGLWYCGGCISEQVVRRLPGEYIVANT
jgi:hypothetical protein